MNKKLILAAVSMLYSLSASAGYVQYNFNGSIAGHVIQNDTDQSIAYYNFTLPIHGTPQPFSMQISPQASEGVTQLQKVSTHFINNGPTNFSIFSDFGGDQVTDFNIAFSRDAFGIFGYTANYASSIYFSDGYSDYAGTLWGTVTQGAVHPDFARWLDSVGGYAEHVSRIVPQYIGPSEIPEPATLGLFALGAVGLAMMRRRQS